MDLLREGIDQGRKNILEVAFSLSAISSLVSKGERDAPGGIFKRIRRISSASGTKENQSGVLKNHAYQLCIIKHMYLFL